MLAVGASCCRNDCCEVRGSPFNSRCQGLRPWTGRAHGSHLAHVASHSGLWRFDACHQFKSNTHTTPSAEHCEQARRYSAGRTVSELVACHSDALRHTHYSVKLENVLLHCGGTATKTGRCRQSIVSKVRSLSNHWARQRTCDVWIRGVPGIDIYSALRVRCETPPAPSELGTRPPQSFTSHCQSQSPPLFTAMQSDTSRVLPVTALQIRFMHRHHITSKSGQRESIKGSLWRFDTCHQSKSNTHTTPSAEPREQARRYSAGRPVPVLVTGHSDALRRRRETRDRLAAPRRHSHDDGTLHSIDRIASKDGVESQGTGVHTRLF